MNLLDDPALRLRVPVPQPAPASGGVRVRLLPTSCYAKQLGLPRCAEGEVRDRYIRDDGSDVLSLWIEGVGYCTGVPRTEVERVER